MSLFRPEVYEERQVRLNGDVLLAGASSNWPLILLVFSIVLTFVACVAFGSYARTETAVGELEPAGATTDVFPTRAGVVTNLRVTEGGLVRAGQPLLTIVVEQASASHTDPAAENLRFIDDQDAQIGDQMVSVRHSEVNEAAKLSAQIEQASQQIDSLKSEISIQQRAVQSTRDSFEPLAAATDQGYVSKIEFETKRQQFLNAKVQLSQLESQMAQAEGQLRLARVSLSELPSQTSQKVEELQANRDALVGKRIDIESGRSYVITAPVDGRVSALQIKSGTMVDSQKPLFSISNSGADLHAKLYVTSSAIGFTRVGQEVRLMYDAFPYQRFGSFKGRIISISRTILSPNELRLPMQLQIKDPVYLLDVALPEQKVNAYGEIIRLQAGMTLHANLILDRRSFLSWMIEPINAIRNRS